MKYDYDKLRNRIIEKYVTYTNFSNKLGVSRQIVSGKLTNTREFTRKDIISWCKLLNIPKSKIGEYFFTPKV